MNRKAHFNKTYASLLWGALLLFSAMMGCNPSANDKKATTSPIFEPVAPSSSGIQFTNWINDTAKYSIFSLAYIYAGGGVAVGDIDNDGWQDLFFSGNQVPSTLYLNKGDFQFEDITESAGINTLDGYNTGTVMADVNGDGFTDIYVCRSYLYPGDSARNLLYINNGDRTFTEAAKAYGLDDPGLTTSVSFFDMDRDGDLDAYVMNYPMFDGDPSNFFFYKVKDRDSITSDRLYEQTEEGFVDISAKAGLPVEKASGLGLVISDLNMDGWPDIYVANDWAAPDYIYYNQQDGTFADRCNRLLTKSSFFSMGMDIGDVNNDGWPDVYVNDMAPSDHYRRHTILNQAPLNYYSLQKRNHPVEQISRNMLQINQRGQYFRETGELAGIARTDWSWGAVLADFNNDGHKDLMVGNGNKRDIGNMDYERLMFSNEEAAHYKINDSSFVKMLPLKVIPNRIFENQGDAGFINRSSQWGIEEDVNTQGLSYADLNNDGKLDLILNNSDAPASIYRNIAGEEHHSLRIRIEGSEKNSAGIGTKAWAWSNGQMQYAELSNARGFQSSSEPLLHFGTGSASIIDSLLVEFPGGKWIQKQQVATGELLVISESEAVEVAPSTVLYPNPTVWFRDITAAAGLRGVVHKENPFRDFKVNKLSYRRFSREGPALAVADINGDGFDDFYLGGAAGFSGRLFVGQADSGFIEVFVETFAEHLAAEDVAASFIDVNGDGFADLYVASGGQEFPDGDEHYQDRIYLGNGKQEFQLCTACLPPGMGSTAAIAADDFDKDGDIDLFVGGRILPGSVGIAPRSYLLQNDGQGNFTDVTGQVSADLVNIGMVTDAVWADMDMDGREELLVTGEYMPVSIFNFEGEKAQLSKASLNLPELSGWWTSLSVTDLNRDGRPDIVAGNWGLNSIYRADKNLPMTLLVGDFDNNSTSDHLLFIPLEGEQGTMIGRDGFCRGMTNFYNRYHTYEDFAKTPAESIVPKHKYRAADKLTVTELRSGVFLSDDAQGYQFLPFPPEGQTAPVKSVLHWEDPVSNRPYLLLLGGTNSHYFDQGRIDALEGVVMTFENGQPKVVSDAPFGSKPAGIPQNASFIHSADALTLLVARNSGPVKLFRWSAGSPDL